MKSRICLMITLALVISVSLIAFYEVAKVAAERNESTLSPMDIALSGTVTGGGYQLQAVYRPISIADTKYLVRGPMAPTLNGDGCCCTYVPCIVKPP
ncbi:MAG: hypothetical protein JW908_08620 [Anaerolineales bacterium]|nr:hypothetical protein [Anaerolineales bacterium]